MADPQTTNILLSIPSRGSDVGTWDTPVNGDFNSIDGYLGGVQTISASSSPITLTAPAGSATPSGGPTQAQNAVLRFTGTLTAGVQVTLPLPGYYIIENLTTGAFVLSFRAVGSGEVIGVDQGDVTHIYNDGTNVRFDNLGRIGSVEIWAGISAMPAWVTACTKPPYLLCDGTVYTGSNFPYLSSRLQGQFGGNGVTTFGVPDLRGRVPLPYDGTGSRITVGVSGLNGQTIGAAGGDQNMAQHNHTYSGTTSTMNQTTTHAHGFSALQNGAGSGVGGGGSFGTTQTSTTQSANIDHTHNYGGTTAVAGSGASGNVQPSQVTGIAVIRAA